MKKWVLLWLIVVISVSKSQATGVHDDRPPEWNDPKVTSLYVLQIIDENYVPTFSLEKDSIGDTRISFYTGIEDFDSLFIKSCVAAFEPYFPIEGDGVEDLFPLYKCVVHNDYPNLGEQLKETYSHVIPYIKLLHTDTIWLTGVEPILKPKTLIHQTINGLYIEKGINDIADVFILIHKVAKFFLQQQRIIKLI